MNPKTKKYLLIGGAVVAVAAIWWFFGRNKGDLKSKQKDRITKGLKKSLAQSDKFKAAVARNQNPPKETTQTQRTT